MTALGRKGIVTLVGMGLVTVLAVVALLTGGDASAAIGAIGVMVTGFCGANAAISWKYAANGGREPGGT